MNNHNECFPRELLGASVQTRRDYFLRKTINHPHLDRARSDLVNMINCVSAPDIAILTGPTGVGKTTLGMKIETALIEANRQEMEQDLNFLPVVRLSAIAPNQGGFTWKDLHVRLLRLYDETQVRQRTLFTMDPYRALDAPRGRAASGYADEALQRAVESCVRERRTRVLIIDEAHHILLAAKGKRLREQFEVIKSLSIASSATIVLIGTYELLNILEQSAQLIRRSRVIHLPRYAWENSADAKSFRAALLTFQRHMPFPVEPNLVDSANLFYLLSAGCIGILKEWLDKAVENALLEGRDTIDYEYALRFAHSNKSIHQVYEEAMEGEDKLVDISLDELRMYVENETLSRRKKPSTHASEGSARHQATSTGKKKRRPGQRNPVRDPIGANGDLFNFTQPPGV